MKKALARLLCSGSVSALGAAPAQADEAEPWFAPTPNSTRSTVVVDTPSTDDYSSRDAEPGSASSRASANPAGRTTKALWPHPSTHVPGTINAGMQQTCPVTVAKNSVEAKLWEHRWWGCNVIDGPQYSSKGTRKKSTVYTNASCRDNSIRVTGYGHYEWGDEHVRSVEVSKTMDIDC